jgi:Restriction endonuclease
MREIIREPQRMHTTSLTESKAIAEMASLLYEFLPGSSAWSGTYTWANVAADVGVPQLWTGGSKRPAITRLLEQCLRTRRELFCPLIVTSVKAGLAYRLKKPNPVQREEIENLNGLLRTLGFAIPELHGRAFLDTLPASQKQESPPAQPMPPKVDTQARQVRAESLRDLHQRFLALMVCTDTQRRGYDFESLLTDLFELEKVAPRGSFRVAGEQIDGSFSWGDSAVFLVEARWRSALSDAADLYVLKGKVDGKSAWTRGMFISINGLTQPAAETFSKGKVANLITFDGQDLILILEDRWTLAEALKVKLRHAGETGDILCALARAEKPRN